MKNVIKAWMVERGLAWFRWSHQGGISDFLAYEDYRTELKTRV